MAQPFTPPPFLMALPLREDFFFGFPNEELKSLKSFIKMYFVFYKLSKISANCKFMYIY